MADVTLSTGREIVIDLTKITLKQYRALFDKSQPQAEEDATIAACAGLTLDEYLGLIYPDFKRIAAAFFRKAREPLADPN